MILFAHRGASAHAPENTLAAFRLALAMGANGLESDAWVTADGVAVLDHDGFADGESVPIASVRRADLPAHIPSLADLYAECGTDFELSLDVKDTHAFAAVVGAARAAGAESRLWLCFERWRQLAEWRPSVPGVRLVDSTYLGFMSGGPERRAEQLATARIDAVNLHRSEWEPALRATFASAGLVTLGWDAQSATELDALMAVGVDGVVSDHVDRMVEAAGRATRQP